MTSLRPVVICLFLATALSAWSASNPSKVACIGDSITEGAGLGDRTYPAKLGNLLGAEYEVRNFGLGGRTLLKKGDYPYWNESTYQVSLSWEPDIVVIKLGTNDSKPWNWQYGAEYVGDYEEMIASYQNLPSQPRILLATPCPVFGDGAFSISPSVVADEIAPAVRDLVNRLGLELIDYHERMAGQSSTFPDTVHPNASGTTVMAVLAYAVIVQADPDPPVPSLTLTEDTSGTAVLEWPIAAGVYVLQERADLIYPRTSWVVTPSITINGGAAFRMEINSNRPRFFYRLWRP